MPQNRKKERLGVNAKNINLLELLDTIIFTKKFKHATKEKRNKIPFIASIILLSLFSLYNIQINLDRVKIRIVSVS